MSFVTEKKVIPLWIQILFLGIFGIFLYYPTLQAPFQFDGIRVLSENYRLRHLTSIGVFLKELDPRFLTRFTFALDYQMHGLNVLGYHLVNLSIHLMTAMLVVVLTRALFRTPALHDVRLSVRTENVAFLAGLFFIVHPVQTQAVTYIVQRFASLATLFYVATLVLYLKARLEVNRKAYGAALVTALMAMLSKETALTLPLALALTEFFFMRDAAHHDHPAWKPLLPFLLMLAVIPGMHFLRDLFQLTDTAYWGREAQDISRMDYFITQWNVLKTYLRLIVYPVPQNLDYDYPISRTVFEHGALGSLVLLIALAGCGVFFYRRQRLLSFGIAWFFLTLSVESSFIPISDVIFEHRLYLPMAGVSIAGAYAVDRWLHRARLLFLVTILMVSSLAITTVMRNAVWRDGITLWADTVSKSPNKARPYRNLAYHLNEAGRHKEAIKACAKALDLDPKASGCYLTMGVAYGKLGDVDREIETYEQLIELDEVRTPKFFNNLGSAYGKKGDFEKATRYFQQGLRFFPDYPPLYNNLGFAHDQMGQYELSMQNYLKAIDLDPDFAEAYHYLGITLAKKGVLDESLKMIQKSIKLDDENADAFNSLGIVFQKLGQFQQAVLAFESALRINPRYLRPYFNLIDYFEKRGDLTRAALYRRRLESVRSLSPQQPTTL